MKADQVISVFPWLSELIDFPERHFDRILGAKTETWILIGCQVIISTKMKCRKRYRVLLFSFNHLQTAHLLPS